MVSPCELPKTDMFVPIPQCQKVRTSHDRIQGAVLREQVWINEVKKAVDKDELDPENRDITTWAGHFASQQQLNSILPPAEIGMCPLFPDKITNQALLSHLIRLCQKGTEFLNPGQTPVLGADQQVFTLLKQLQWKYPDEFGEDKLVVMLGGLHIEDEVYKMLGKLIRGSGWEWALTKADIFTSGRVSSALDESHIKRSRYAHQVSLAAFSILQNDAYT